MQDVDFATHTLERMPKRTVVMPGSQTSPVVECDPFAAWGGHGWLNSCCRTMCTRFVLQKESPCSVLKCLAAVPSEKGPLFQRLYLDVSKQNATSIQHAKHALRQEAQVTSTAFHFI